MGCAGEGAAAGRLEKQSQMVRGGRREEGSEWGSHIYLWQIHVDIWQNQYNIVKLKNNNNNKKVSLWPAK